MMLCDLIDRLESLRIDDDTKVYIQIGLQQVEVDEIETHKETDYEYGAVILK